MARQWGGRTRRSCDTYVCSALVAEIGGESPQRPAQSDSTLTGRPARRARSSITARCLAAPRATSHWSVVTTKDPNNATCTAPKHRRGPRLWHVRPSWRRKAFSCLWRVMKELSGRPLEVLTALGQICNVQTTHQALRAVIARVNGKRRRHLVPAPLTAERAVPLGHRLAVVKQVCQCRSSHGLGSRGGYPWDVRPGRHGPRL